jgi:hypothetical protein
VEWAELYDRGADPHEMRNLWRQPEAAAVERAMVERMTREMLAWSETSPAPMGLA